MVSPLTPYLGLWAYWKFRASPIYGQFSIFGTMVDMAVFREKKLPEGAHWCFRSDSRRSITSLRPIFLCLDFRYEDPKYGHIWNPYVSHFGENTSFVGFVSKFLAATKNFRT